jgi:hypothetical protein
MNINDFCASCEWVTGEGAEIAEAIYNGQSFGSWSIGVPHKGRRRRAVWDGKDSWLIIQSGQSEGDWTDDWIGRDPDEQTVEQVVRRLRSD